MEASNLHTAATYVNNLLLARGLLRNGKPVAFADLTNYIPIDSASPSEKPLTPASAIVADVINLVHDLVLKRDRDQEHHESLSSTLRSLRTDASKSTTELERLRQRNRELRRQTGLCESSQRSAETAAKNAEKSAKALKEELARVKGLLAQVRTQFTNDLRKRDIQIESLKKHLSERQRGNKTATGPSITIRPGSTGMGGGPNNTTLNETSPCLEDEDYSLKQETTDFLTQLSQNLSDENDQLISLIRGTVGTLKELQGLPHNQHRKHQESPSISNNNTDGEVQEDMVNVSEVSHQALAFDLETVLGSLTELLTNPSFAPIEEVHMREEEVQRLRRGWEMMEGRWLEAISLMQGWRKRMLNGGDTIKLDDLKMGLRLGEGLDSPSRNVLNTLDATADMSPGQESGSEDPSNEEDEVGPNMNDLPEIDESFSQEQERPLFKEPEDTREKRPAALAATMHERALRETTVNNNAGSVNMLDDNFGEFSDQAENSSPIPPKPHFKPVSASSTTGRKKGSVSRKASLASTRMNRPVRTACPIKSSLASDNDLSVHEKLRIAEREAARVSTSNSPKSSRNTESMRDKIKQSDSQTSRVGSLRGPENGKAGQTPVKRTKIGGRPRRRKSTLSPDELEQLMVGSKNSLGELGAV